MYVKFKYIFFLLAILVIFYLTTLISSFIGISRAIDDNDPYKLDYYIHNELLKKNLNLFFSNNLQENYKSKSFSIDVGDENFSGKLSEKTTDVFFFNISKTLSDDFSKSETLLFFYYHPENINYYFKKVFLNNGNYYFQEFIEERDVQKYDLVQSIDKGNSIGKENVLVDNELKEDWLRKFLSKLRIIPDRFDKFYSKIKRSEYIFFTNPITFKLKVQHKSENYLILLKLVGFKWSIIKFELELSNYIF
tara:strand:- start:136 stop:882 length:747 start_codon:yes stop_codon:yes gene_type:complete